MTFTPRQQRHLGIYGICIRGEYVLLIRKMRGPYTGLLDVPGGGIEFGESPEDALRREFLEETGLVVTDSSLLSTASTLVSYTAADGVFEQLHHLGIFYRVAVASEGTAFLPFPNTLPDGEDSGGAFWTRCDTLDKVDLTPFAQQLLPQHKTISVV